jgi:DNA polymerase III epsilon subunit-like protein
MSYNPNLIIVFDTETTGFSPEKNEVVQLSYILYDIQKQEVVYATKPGEDIVNINGQIPKKTSDIHGITKDMTLNKLPIKDHIDKFINYCNQASTFVGHNIKFDINMICGQIKKIISETPESKVIYNVFLERFQMVGKDLPEAAYCTMMESQGICAELRGTNKLKYEKLMEVHKLLFRQDIGGQLHNALVDISVTLRVYLKLTLDIDICESISEFAEKVDSVTNKYTICSLIKPIPISEQVENVNYTGDLITSLKIITDGLVEEKIMVQTIAKQLVSDITKQAISNITTRVAPQETMCTNITICRAIIKSGKRKGEGCNRLLNGNADFCKYHTQKNKVAPETALKINNTVSQDNLEAPIDSSIKTKPKNDDIKSFSTNYTSNLFKGLTKQNKVVPVGGIRKTRRVKKTRRVVKKVKKSRRKTRKHKYINL